MFRKSPTKNDLLQQYIRTEFGKDIVIKRLQKKVEQSFVNGGMFLLTERLHAKRIDFATIPSSIKCLKLIVDLLERLDTLNPTTLPTAHATGSSNQMRAVFNPHRLVGRNKPPDTAQPRAFQRSSLGLRLGK
ncbi:hypothetical protein TNCV_564211 [Trichonephila clavipes]|nr:hypothetical protein TNCV_564211 [Trichonephila clavipes]